MQRYFLKQYLPRYLVGWSRTYRSFPSDTPASYTGTGFLTPLAHLLCGIGDNTMLGTKYPMGSNLDTSLHNTYYHPKSTNINIQL